MEGFKEIAIQLSEEALLEQVIEESGELIQACAKRLRILRNENFTPISKESNFENLIEEMAAVTLCTNVLYKKYFDDVSEGCKIISSKLERWKKRLNKKEK